MLFKRQCQVSAVETQRCHHFKPDFQR